MAETYRRHYGDMLTVEGERAIVLDCRRDLPRKELAHCIALALTYHLMGRR